MPTSTMIKSVVDEVGFNSSRKEIQKRVAAKTGIKPPLGYVGIIRKEKGNEEGVNFDNRTYESQPDRNMIRLKKDVFISELEAVEDAVSEVGGFQTVAVQLAALLPLAEQFGGLERFATIVHALCTLKVRKWSGEVSTTIARALTILDEAGVEDPK